MTHKHQFFKIQTRAVFKQGLPAYRYEAEREGVQVVCAICGEVRDVWNTGEIQILVKGQQNVSDHDKDD